MEESSMDKATLTHLLAFIADSYEANQLSRARMKPEYMKKLLLAKFPTLTEAQIKHILRII